MNKLDKGTRYVIYVLGIIYGGVMLVLAAIADPFGRMVFSAASLFDVAIVFVVPWLIARNE